MSGMFWIALELSNPKIGLISKLSLPYKKLRVLDMTAVKTGKTASLYLKLSQLSLFEGGG